MDERINLRAPVRSVGWWIHEATRERIMWAFLVLPGGTNFRFRFPKTVKLEANIKWHSDTLPTRAEEQDWENIRDFLSEYNGGSVWCHLMGNPAGVQEATFTFARCGGFVYYPNPVVVTKSDWVLA